MTDSLKDGQVKEDDPLLSDTVTYDESSVGQIKDSIWSALAMGDFRPDNISIATYLKMLETDAQVGAGATLFKLALLSKPWDIKFPDGEEPKNAKDAIEIIDFLKWNLENVNRTVHYRGGIRSFIEELLDGPMLGFAVAEPTYGMAKYKDENRVIIKKLKVLPQETIKFYSDKYGDLTKVEQNIGGSVINLKPLEKFIIWPFNMRRGNWYGLSLLKRSYKHWYIKEFLIKKWNIFLERKAVPILYGKTRASNIKNLNRILATTNEKTTITVEKDDDLGIIGTKIIGGQFKSAIQYHDTMIFRGMLTPTLLLGQEDVGARALGDTHFQVFMWIVNKMKEDVGAIMNNLFVGLIKFNYPDVKVMPEIVIPELSTEDRDKFADVVGELIKAGVLQPDEEWIRKRLGFPINKSPTIITPPTEPVIEDEPVEDDEKKTDPQKMVSKVAANLKINIAPRHVEAMMNVAESVGYGKLREYTSKFSDEFVSQIEKILDGYDPESSDRYDYLAELKTIKNPRDASVAKMIIDMDKGYLKKMVPYYTKAINEAQGIKSALKVDEIDIANSDTIKVLTERAFTSAGLLNSALLDAGKNVLITGIQTGLSEEEIITRLEEVLPNYSENRLRTIVRTNVTAATSMGGLEIFRNTNGFVRGVMYQAILDDRTTPFCESHDGETLPIDDPRVDALSPPNHYMCRSMWVPVSILDENVGINSWDNAGLEPQEGFGVNPFGKEELYAMG